MGLGSEVAAVAGKVGKHGAPSRLSLGPKSQSATVRRNGPSGVINAAESGLASNAGQVLVLTALWKKIVRSGGGAAQSPV